MKRKSQMYKEAIQWIADNDEPCEFNYKIVGQMISVALIADLFKLHELDVAQDVVTYRHAFAQR